MSRRWRAVVHVLVAWHLHTVSQHCSGQRGLDASDCVKYRWNSGEWVPLYPGYLKDVGFPQKSQFGCLAATQFKMLLFQLQDLICQILQGHLQMFKKDSFVNVLSKLIDKSWEFCPCTQTIQHGCNSISLPLKKKKQVCFADASLEWETIEQYFLWQLISVHNIPVEHIMPILPKLEFISTFEMTSFSRKLPFTKAGIPEIFLEATFLSVGVELK